MNGSLCMSTKKCGPMILCSITLFFVMTIPVLADNWVAKTSMPTARCALATAMVDGKIYAVGGALAVKQTYYSVLEVYDPEADTWETKTNMPSARYGMGSGVVNGKIYTFGGWEKLHRSTDTGGSTNVFEYDPTLDTWASKTSMPTRRAGAPAFTVDDKIYVIGGVDVIPGLGLATVEMYNPTTDSWTTLEDMPTSRHSMCGAVVSGKIYVIGGVSSCITSTALTTVEEYDPATNTWTQKSDMPTPRTASCSCVINGKIYVIGGSLNNMVNAGSVVEVYDPVADQWETHNDIPASLMAGNACASGDYLYVFGGSLQSMYGEATAEVWQMEPTTLSQNNDLPYRPRASHLFQNYPNPFNPSTVISYELQHSTAVQVRVYNLAGQVVAHLVTGIESAGKKEVVWNGLDDSGVPVNNGIYIIRLQTEETSVSIKAMCLK